jgi:adenylate kinase family enzyme
MAAFMRGIVSVLQEVIVRIAAVGTTGAGKTTLAKALAAELALPHIELDALHWGAGWQALTQTGPEEFVHRVATAIAADAWVLDGNYEVVRNLIWTRATHLVWLDYDRRVVIYRVVRRSFTRAALRTKLWAGNVETWRQMLRPSHPIRWAWRTWPRRRGQIANLIGRDEYAHLVVLHLRRPQAVDRVVRRLIEAAVPAQPL